MRGVTRVLVVDNYDSFVYNLVQYLGELGAEPIVHRHDAIGMDEAVALEPDAVLISPGPGRPEDAGVSNALIAHFAGRVPVLGVCRGAQLVNVHLGGTLHQHVPAHTDASLPIDQAFHRVAFAADSIGRSVYGAEIAVNSLHHQGIDRLADGLVASGVTVGGPDDGLVEAVEIADKPVLAVQWHPEMTGRVDPAMEWLVETALSSSS